MKSDFQDQSAGYGAWNPGRSDLVVPVQGNQPHGKGPHDKVGKGEGRRRRAGVSLNLFEDQILKQGTVESVGDEEAKAPGVCNLLTRVRLDR